MSVRALHLPHLHLRGLVGAVRARRQSSRRRAVADEWLIWGARAQPASPLLTARAAELTSVKLRRQLAALARRIIVEQSDPGCRAYAVNRPAIRRHLELFVVLAERLESPEPVNVRGVALAAWPERSVNSIRAGSGESPPARTPLLLICGGRMALN